MFSRIVAGWDGSPESEVALDWAADHAADLPLTIIHAIGGSPTSSEYLRAGGELSAERTRLMDVADRLRAEHPELQATTSTVHGQPRDTLAEHLTAETLVVVGSPARHEGSRWALGSRLAGHQGAGAVAVIPSDVSRSPRSGVVVGVDGSAASLRAVRFAAGEAARLEEALHVVHAWQIPAYWNPAVVDYSADVALLEEMHRDVLDEAVELAESLDVHPIGHLEQGLPHDVLERVGTNATLVVVGRHSAGALARFLLGSTSRDLLQSMPAPVMVVGPLD